MEKFNFDTGMKEFEINDAVTVSFNPTDPETIKKIFDVFDSLDAKQAAYKAEIARCGETKEIFDIASRRDAEMREVLDSLFGKPICEPLSELAGSARQLCRPSTPCIRRGHSAEPGIPCGSGRPETGHEHRSTCRNDSADGGRRHPRGRHRKRKQATDGDLAGWQARAWARGV